MMLSLSTSISLSWVLLLLCVVVVCVPCVSAVNVCPTETIGPLSISAVNNVANGWYSADLPVFHIPFSSGGGTIRFYDETASGAVTSYFTTETWCYGATLGTTTCVDASGAYPSLLSLDGSRTAYPPGSLVYRDTAIVNLTAADVYGPFSAAAYSQVFPVTSVQTFLTQDATVTIPASRAGSWVYLAMWANDTLGNSGAMTRIYMDFTPNECAPTVFDEEVAASSTTHPSTPCLSTPQVIGNMYVADNINTASALTTGLDYATGFYVEQGGIIQFTAHGTWSSAGVTSSAQGSASQLTIPGSIHLPSGVTDPHYQTGGLVYRIDSVSAYDDGNVGLAELPTYKPVYDYSSTAATAVTLTSSSIDVSSSGYVYLSQWSLATSATASQVNVSTVGILNVSLTYFPPSSVSVAGISIPTSFSCPVVCPVASATSAGSVAVSPSSGGSVLRGYSSSPFQSDVATGLFVNAGGTLQFVSTGTYKIGSNRIVCNGQGCAGGLLVTNWLNTVNYHMEGALHYTIQPTSASSGWEAPGDGSRVSSAAIYLTSAYQPVFGYNAAVSNTYNGSLYSAMLPVQQNGYVYLSSWNMQPTGLSTDGSLTVSVYYYPPAEECSKPIIQVPNSPVYLEATSAAGATYTYTSGSTSGSTVIVTDSVNGLSVPTVVCLPASDVLFPLNKQQTITCAAIDATGRMLESSWNVLVHDTTPPVIARIANITAQATSAQGAIVTWNPLTATDTVTPTADMPVACTPSNGSLFALTSTIVHCYTHDAANNPASITFTVSVVDTIPPTWNPYVDASGLVFEATGPTTVISYPLPTSSDAVTASPLVACSPASGTSEPLGVYTINCTTVDAADNVQPQPLLFSITVHDTTPPVFQSYTPPAAVEATSPFTAVSFASPTARDLVTANPTVVCTPASGSLFSVATTTVTCTATDGKGNHVTMSFPILVHDTTPPTFDSSSYSSLTVQATSEYGATGTYSTPVADDLVTPSSSMTVLCAPSSASFFALGSTSVHCYTHDAAGNYASVNFLVSVVDTIPPTWNTYVNATGLVFEATGPTTVITYPLPTSTDVVTPYTLVTCSPTTGAAEPLGIYTVTCTTVDAAGNVQPTALTFSVIVHDTTPPVFLSAYPDTRIVEATGSITSVTYATPSATDLVTANPTIVCSPTSPDSLPLGPANINCTATDGSGNQVNMTFEITVIDTTPPVFTVPVSDYLFNASASDTPVTYTLPAATDLVSPADAIIVLCSPASDTLFALGSTPVICTATDVAGNTNAPITFHVIISDDTPPTFSPVSPPAVTTEATGPQTTVGYALPTAIDSILLTAPIVQCTPPSGSLFAAVSQSVVTCIASNTYGLASSAQFLVTVTDTTPAVFLAYSEPLPTEATGQLTVVNYALPPATDLVTAHPQVGCLPMSGSGFSVGTTTVSCTAEDNARNFAYFSFPVLVYDSVKPWFLTYPLIKYIEATGPTTNVAYPIPSATDLVTTNPPVTCYPASSASLSIPVGQLDVTCVTQDAAGNINTLTFVEIVQDTTPPVFVTPIPDQWFAATALSTSIAYTLPAVTDLVTPSPLIQVNCNPPPQSAFSIGSSVVACTARDQAGNTNAPMTFSVTVSDQTPPKFGFTPLPVVQEATGTTTVVQFSTPVAIDPVLITPPTVICSPPSGSSLPLDITHVTCVATNQYLLSATTGFNITVRDTTAPTFTAFTPPSYQATSETSVVNYPIPTATDAVTNNPTVQCNPPSSYPFPVEATPVTCIATDHASNVRSVSFLVTVYDNIPPVIIPSPDITIEATAKYLSGVQQSGATGYLRYSVPLATDAVTVNPLVVCSPSSDTEIQLTGTGYPGQITPIICTSEDEADNPAVHVTFNAILQDTTAPSWLPYIDPDFTQATSATTTSVVYPLPQGVDNVLYPGSPVADCTPPSGTDFPLGDSMVSCILSDAAGNFNSKKLFIPITVADTIAPRFSISYPLAQSIPATGPTTAAVYALPSATDAVTLSPVVVCSPPSGSVWLSLETLQVGCTATDAAGNVATLLFDLTVVDTTPPVWNITTFSDIVIEASSTSSEVVSYPLPQAIDLVTPLYAVTVECNPPPGSTFPVGSSLVSCNATDTAGNSLLGPDLFSVSVVDYALPLFTPSSIALIQVEATGPNTLVSLPSLVATDPVEPLAVLTIICNPAFTICPTGQSSCPAPGANFAALTTTTVTCSAVNAASTATSTISFDVKITDNTPPVFQSQCYTSPAPVQAIGPSTPVIFNIPIANDLVAGAVTPTCSPPSGSYFALGTTLVTCGAVDENNNAASMTFNVIVVDTMAPQWLPYTLPQPIVATGVTTPFTYQLPVAQDVVFGSALTVSCTPVPNTPLAVGTHQVTCTARAPFSGSVPSLPYSFSLTVTDPAPTWNTYVNAYSALSPYPATIPTSILDYPLPAAASPTDPAVAVTCNPSPTYPFPVGRTTVTCSAQDVYNTPAATTFAFTIAVVDGLNPVFGSYQTIITAPATSLNSTVVYTPKLTATDAVAGAANVSCNYLNSTFPIGSTVVTCTATNQYQNTSSASYTVTVTDHVPPAFNSAPLPVFAQVGYPATSVPVPLIAPVATDAIYGQITSVCNAPLGPMPVGITNVSCTATDGSGNQASVSFLVVVVQITATDPLGLGYTGANSPQSSIGGLWAPTGNSIYELVFTFSLHVIVTSIRWSDISTINAPSVGYTFEPTTACQRFETCGALDTFTPSSTGSTQTFNTTTLNQFRGQQFGLAFSLASGTSPSLYLSNVLFTFSIDATWDAYTWAPTLTYSTGTYTVQYVSPTATSSEFGYVPVTCLPASGSGASLFPPGVATTVTCTAVEPLGESVAPLTFTVTPPASRTNTQTFNYATQITADTVIGSFLVPADYNTAISMSVSISGNTNPSCCAPGGVSIANTGGSVFANLALRQTSTYSCQTCCNSYTCNCGYSCGCGWNCDCGYNCNCGWWGCDWCCQDYCCYYCCYSCCSYYTCNCGYTYSSAFSDSASLSAYNLVSLGTAGQSLSVHEYVSGAYYINSFIATVTLTYY